MSRDRTPFRHNYALGLGVKRVELIFRQRPVSPSKLDRNIVKATGTEAAVEMTQSRNDHSDDRDLDIRARLIEDKEIETRGPGAETMERRPDSMLGLTPSGTAVVRPERAWFAVSAWKTSKSQPCRKFATWIS